MTRTTIPRTLAVTPRMEEAWQAVDACFGCFRLTAGAVPHVRLSGGPPGPTERSSPARGHKRSRPLDVGKHRDWQPLGEESTALSGPTADDRIGARLDRDTPTCLDRHLLTNPRLELRHVGCRHRYEHRREIGRRDRSGPIVLEIVERPSRAKNSRFDIGETRPCPQRMQSFRR